MDKIKAFPFPSPRLSIFPQLKDMGFPGEPTGELKLGPKSLAEHVKPADFAHPYLIHKKKYERRIEPFI